MFFNFLKKSFLWIVLLLLIFYIVVEKPTIIGDLESKYFPPAPCSVPISYKIGTFDTRFGISQSDFLSTVKQAGTLWGGAKNKKLFMYDTKGSLTINLIYDKRQQTTQQSALLQADVKATDNLAATVKAQYQALEESYRVSEQSYKDEGIFVNLL